MCYSGSPPTQSDILMPSRVVRGLKETQTLAKHTWGNLECPTSNPIWFRACVPICVSLKCWDCRHASPHTDTQIEILKRFIYLFLYVCFPYKYVGVPCIWFAWKSEKGTGFPGAVVTDGLWAMRGCWSLEEQWACFTTEPSLQPEVQSTLTVKTCRLKTEV